ncbi:MAG: hypothetical protein LBF51_02610 [Zoogloeaceae bacterium]|jgi:hypothetical protein|nr:hypothetical protein [Zoogloeaceae bacterium]
MNAYFSFFRQARAHIRRRREFSPSPAKRESERHGADAVKSGGNSAKSETLGRPAVICE